MNLICVHIKHISSTIMNSLSCIDKAISHIAIWGASILFLSPTSLELSISILPCILLFLIIDYVCCVSLLLLPSRLGENFPRNNNNNMELLCMQLYVIYTKRNEWAHMILLFKPKMFDRWWVYDTKFMLYSGWHLLVMWEKSFCPFLCGLLILFWSYLCKIKEKE